MDKLVQALKNTYDYSDYQLALVKYTLLSIGSELSKMLLLGVFYCFIGELAYFAMFLLLLSLLRFNSGGFHCKHYTTCLLLTFTISYFAIVVLPNLGAVDTLLIELLLIICLIVNYYIGPIASPLRPTPNSLLLKHCKNNSFIIIFIFFIIVSISSSNQVIYPYLLVGFWTIILHTFQMIFAKILIKGGQSYAA